MSEQVSVFHLLFFNGGRCSSKYQQCNVFHYTVRTTSSASALYSFSTDFKKSTILVINECEIQRIMQSCHLQIGVAWYPSVSLVLSLACPGCVGVCRRSAVLQCRDDLEVHGVGLMNHSHERLLLRALKYIPIYSSAVRSTPHNSWCRLQSNAFGS
jgi:hypothetical protein